MFFTTQETLQGHYFRFKTVFTIQLENLCLLVANVTELLALFEEYHTPSAILVVVFLKSKDGSWKDQDYTKNWGLGETLLLLSFNKAWLTVLFLYRTQEVCNNVLMDTLNMQLARNWYIHT